MITTTTDPAPLGGTPMTRQTGGSDRTLNPRPGGSHDHSWAEDMDEVRACCPDFNPGLTGTGIRCPGDYASG